MPDASSLTLRVEYPGHLSDIPVLGAAVEAFCRARGVSPQAAHKLVLGLEELLTNLVVHGAGTNAAADAAADGVVPYAAENGASNGASNGAASKVWVAVGLSEDRLVAIYEDSGAAFDPMSVPTPDLAQPLEDRPVGGLGVYLLRSLMDEVTYARVNGRNQVTLLLRV